MIVKIDCQDIHNWESFHDEFSRAFGFPDFYGRNMNAWIDCMSSLNKPKDGMTQVHCDKDNEVIILQLENVSNFKKRCPECYDAIIESSAFVNWRLIDAHEKPVLLLSFGFVE